MSYNYTDLVEKFHLLGKVQSDAAKHCTFLLESIIREVALTKAEKSEMKKFRTDESENILIDGS